MPLVALQNVPGEKIEMEPCERTEEAELIVLSAEQVLRLRSQIARVIGTFRKIRTAH